MATVLLIDTHDAVRTATSKMLERDGHDVETRSSAQDLLRDCRAVTPDVLIVEEDCLQQVDDDTLQALHDQVPDLTIIVMSSRGAGVTGLISVRGAASLGADMTLAKPFGCARLRAVLQKASLENNHGAAR